MRLKGDLVSACLAALEGGLDDVSLTWDARPSLGVVMVADGYPEGYSTGERISGLGLVSDDVKVFHAGTALQDGNVVTAGGRVLCVTAVAGSVSAAQQRAYETIAQIDWPGARFRKDIGYRAVAREAANA